GDIVLGVPVQRVLDRRLVADIAAPVEVRNVGEPFAGPDVEPARRSARGAIENVRDDPRVVVAQGYIHAEIRIRRVLDVGLGAVNLGVTDVRVEAGRGANVRI